MKHTWFRLFSLRVIIALLVLVPVAVAQIGEGYDLTWSTIDNGGGTSVGGGYILNSTIGQPDVGTALAGGGYTLVGGFWGGVMTQYRVYLPVVMNGS